LPLLVVVVCFSGCSGENAPAPADDAAAGESSSSASAVPAEPSESGDESPKTVEVAPVREIEVTSELEARVVAAAAKPAEEISFDDLNLQLQADAVFRPWMLTDRARELDGKQVRIAGYMLPHTKVEGIESFVLLRNTECKFGPGGQPDHLISVTLRDDVTTVFRTSPIEVEGTIAIAPYEGPDGNTWCIFNLNEGDHVTVVRR
jgi:hypothetical protein